MIEKLIESWLTSANERLYQLPFCSMLQAHGYTVLAVPSHGPGEQGKDVVARDRRGRYHAFQLKSGKLSLPEWQRIRAEVEDLVHIPIVHPGHRTQYHHTPVLVTNGEATHDARQNIRYYENMWRRAGHGRLQLWERGTLLRMFRDAHSSLLPSDLRDIRDYLELFVGDFRDRLPRGTFAKYLETLVSRSRLGPAPKTQVRGLWNMVLLAGYILQQYRDAGNHVSAAEGWTVVAATVLHVAERQRLSETEYSRPLRDAWAGMMESLNALARECIERKDFLESFAFPADPFVYGSRTAIVLGWLSAWALMNKEEAPKGQSDLPCIEVLRRELRNLKVVGEADWPELACIAIVLEDSGLGEVAERLLLQWAGWLSSENGPTKERKDTAIPSPYWLHEKVLAFRHGELPPYDRESFAGRSFTLLSSLDMLVRRMRRISVARLWPEASRALFCEFIPRHGSDFYLWETHRGEFRQMHSAQPASWSAWREETSRFRRKHIPKSLQRQTKWILPFALTYPHRVTREYSALIDSVYGRRC